MTKMATKFTPEVLLSTPRRSAGSPNPTGELVVFTVSFHDLVVLGAQLANEAAFLQKSTYSFDSHSKTGHIGLLDVKTGRSAMLIEGTQFGSPEWLGDHEILFLDSSASDATSLIYMDVRCPGWATTRTLTRYFKLT